MMKTLKIFVAILLCFHFLSCEERQQEAMDKVLPLKVLYVGGSGNWEDEHYTSDEEREADVTKRMGSFKSMLERFFSIVDTIHSEHYVETLSSRYDVTIMDDYIEPIAHRKVERDSTGKIVSDTPTSFFSMDFTKPMLLIGNFSSMTQSLGSKLDWYCKCLDAHAFNYDREHPIFKEPFSVPMVTEEVATPENAYKFELFFDETTQKSMQMMRIQTKGYESDNGFRVGMVSRPGGFDDSPEAESISSGVCSMRNFDAVALGRHGNFFHWGFAASPEFMTEQGRVLFANAIHYISKFDNKGIIARKRDAIIPTRGQHFRELLYFISEKVYNDQEESYDRSNALWLDRKGVAHAKIQNGEILTSTDSTALVYRIRPKRSYSQFLMDHHGPELYGKFGTNARAYEDYYMENRDYFYSKPFMRELVLDEDVKNLKIPNYDIQLLDRCITLLERGSDIGKAMRILKRYTLLDFTTADQWRDWYERNKDKLFFTEAGGYVFLVDSHDKTVEANNYFKGTGAADIPKVPESITPSETDGYNPVSVAAGIVKKEADSSEVIIKIRIHKGYHLYADVSESDPYIATDLKISLPDGYSKIGGPIKPSFEYYNDKGTTIYTGEIVFRQKIVGNGPGIATCYLTWQACEEDFCLPPVMERPFEIELS